MDSYSLLINPMPGVQNNSGSHSSSTFFLLYYAMEMKRFLWSAFTPMTCFSLSLSPIDRLGSFLCR